MKLCKMIGICCAALLVLGGIDAAASAELAGGSDGRLFELRTYYPAPGKMDALNARFREHTTRLFEKHGMTNIGYWVVADAKPGEEKLIYILAHKNREAADASWKAFRSDPDWQKVKAETEKDGPILAKPVESVYLTATDYSKIK